jgi:hypothetical protein
MMQIANAEILRLQNLSDSINRTIDALNQVRQSVYANVNPSVFGGTLAIGGLGHAAAQNAFLQNAFLQNAFVNSTLANQFVSPFANVALANAVTNQLANPYATFATATGLGHTAFNAAYADPYNAARIAATFPFTQSFTQPFTQSFTQPFTQWGYSPFARPMF